MRLVEICQKLNTAERVGIEFDGIIGDLESATMVSEGLMVVTFQEGPCTRCARFSGPTARMVWRSPSLLYLVDTAGTLIQFTFCANGQILPNPVKP